MTFRVADLMLEPVAKNKALGAKGKCQGDSKNHKCIHCTKAVTCQPCTTGPTGGPSTCTSDTAQTACSDCQDGTFSWQALNAAMQAKLGERAYAV